MEQDQQKKVVLRKPGNLGISRVATSIVCSSWSDWEMAWN